MLSFSDNVRKESDRPCKKGPGRSAARSPGRRAPVPLRAGRPASDGRAASAGGGRTVRARPPAGAGVATLTITGFSSRYLLFVSSIISMHIIALLKTGTDYRRISLQAVLNYLTSNCSSVKWMNFFAGSPPAQGSGWLIFRWLARARWQNR